MLREFVSYLKSVFTEGHLLIFTMFDVLGIGIFIFPQLAERLTKNEQVVSNIGLMIFLISFISAHFSLYRQTIIASLPRVEDLFFFTPIIIRLTMLRRSVI